MDLKIADPRKATIQRSTGETNILVELSLDGTGQTQINTPVPFFNHMLTALGKHGRLDLTINAEGDIDIDDHHTVEDVGIVFGQALKHALGDKAGIERDGFAYAPMDEALARSVIDLSGRACVSFAMPVRTTAIGSVRPFQTELVEEFFRAFAGNALMNLHIDLIRGTNTHHCVEAVFKSCAIALRTAVRRSGGTGVPSTKGVI